MQKNNLSWILSQWHVISTSAAPLKMDGVLFQDIRSIIDTMLNSKEVTLWSTRLSQLYSHLADYQNPHETTIKLFPTQIIEVLYRAWRTEGYMGTLQFFTDLLFLYMKVVQFAEMMEGDNLDKENIVPSVKAVHEYLQMHDKDIYAHDAFLSTFFAGKAIDIPPQVAFFQHLGTLGIEHLWDPRRNAYADILAFGDAQWTPQQYTVVGCARFLDNNDFVYGVHGLHTGVFYFLVYDWNNKAVHLKWRLMADQRFHGFNPNTGMTAYDDRNFMEEADYWNGKYDTTLATIDLSIDIDTLDSPEMHLATAMVMDRDKLKVYAKLRASEYQIPGLHEVIVDSEVPNVRKPPQLPRLTFASMQPNDAMYSVATYRQALDDDQLNFAMDAYQLPVLRTI